MPPERADLARKAVFVGAVVATAVVLLALLTALWGPGKRDGSTAAPAYLGQSVAKSKGDSDDSKSDSGSGEGKSDDSSGDDNSKDSKGSGKSSSSKSENSGSSKKSGKSSRSSGSSASSSASSSGAGPSGSARASGSGARPSSATRPNAGAASSGASGGSSPPGTAAPSRPRSGGTAMAQISCSMEVTDEASLKQALASAAPNDVICVKGNVGQSAATPTPVPSLPRLPSASGAPAAPSSGRAGSSDASESASPSAGSPTGGQADPASTGGPPGAGTPSQADCTKEVTDSGGAASAIGGAQPGDRICIKVDDIGVRLEITKGGSEQAPIQIIGNGQTATKGITIKADNVVVDGFTAEGPQAPGISITGNGITVQNNTISKPQGGDGDGLRFFGNNIKILHNTIGETSNSNGHADCMQTFTSGRPSSEHVVIDGNRCEKIANICLMAEGPGDVGDGGGGDGTSADWTLSNNYCEFGASQGYMIEAVQNVTMTNNEFTGKADKAIGLDIGATGAKVADNKLNGIDHEVGMDSSSKKDYQGPEPGGGP